MTSIAIGTVLAIDTGTPAVKEIVKFTNTTGSTFTAIFNNDHGTNKQIALMVPVAELTSIGMPAIKCSPIDVTHLLSDFSYREYIAGIPDGGEIPFEGNFIGDATQDLLTTDLSAGTKVTWCVALGGVPGQDNQCIWMADGRVAGVQAKMQVDQKITLTGSLKLTGKPLIF